MKKVGVLGSGVVGRTLADGFEKRGYEVMLGTSNPKKLLDWQSGTNGKVGSFTRAADFGDLIVLAVKGVAAQDIVAQVKVGISDKLVLDVTNPLSEEKSKDGIRKFFTNEDESLMEKLQELVPEAHFVKAFNYFDSKAMVNSAKSKAQIMNICGNEDGAKAEAKEILAQFGFKSKDLGKVEAAREIEQMAISL
ncbi:NADPH-dependent F420 reductase [Algoriphagus litoralis]|uniref:NADPH-dependent F420 reductase n=1 Tax=Algoriphagus litoralis TaxID=2202829 RepID=UPI000DB9ECDE|nr:NAD(P)-binding domain-containing protein [Algoriphagus litoralis]